MLSPHMNIIAGTEYRFAFEISNPVVEADMSLTDFVPTDKVNPKSTIWAAPPIVLTPNSMALGFLPQRRLDSSVESLMVCNGIHSAVNDAAALFLHKPRFSVKNIGQDSPFPCELNTITVTLESTVPLCAEECFSQITITNLKGATAQSGSVDLQSESGDHLIFTSYPKGPKGKGLWEQVDSQTGKLTLFLTCCMPCGVPHLFSFSVRNPDCFQSAPVVYIEATNADTQTAIALTPMDSPGEDLAFGGTRRTLEILQPDFLTASIKQDSNDPCDVNTLTVKVQSNVPLYSTN